MLLFRGNFGFMVDVSARFLVPGNIVLTITDMAPKSILDLPIGPGEHHLFFKLLIHSFSSVSSGSFQKVPGGW